MIPKVHEMNIFWPRKTQFTENHFPVYERVQILDLGPIISISLESSSLEYHEIKKKMKMKDIKIIRIYQNENYYLRRSYELKKEHKRRQYGWVSEVYGFHGTNAAFANSIRTNNFNWRYAGRTSNHWFNGKGVYFSNDANISRKYPKRGTGSTRLIFLVKLLVQDFSIGNENMILPPEGKDTTVSRHLNEMVKYEDNEFYPMYEIIFNIEQDPIYDSLTLDSIGYSLVMGDMDSQISNRKNEFQPNMRRIEIPSLSIASFLNSDFVNQSNYDEDNHSQISSDEDSEANNHHGTYSRRNYANRKIFYELFTKVLSDIVNLFQWTFSSSSSTSQDDSDSESS